MSTPHTITRPLREAILQRLANSGFIRPVAVIGKPRGGSVTEAVEAALEGMGLCIHVMTPLCREPISNSTGLRFERIECVVQIHEYEPLNDTATNGDELVELVTWLLHQWMPPAELGLNMLYVLPESPRPFLSDDQAAANEATRTDVVLATSGGFEPRPTHI